MCGTQLLIYFKPLLKYKIFLVFFLVRFSFLPLNYFFKNRGPPWWSLPMQGSMDLIPGGELRSPLPCGITKKMFNLNLKNKKNNCKWGGAI